jgi:EF hand domain-containing protein
MSSKKVVIAGLLISIGAFNAAFAESGQGHDADANADATSEMMMQGGESPMGQMGMMDGERAAMMQNMMKMHASMMGNMQGGGGRMGMMDRDMMDMMMGGGEPGNMAEMMTTKLQEFDTDEDGALSLAEFEALHIAAMRERMVDQFQHLDADGDGLVTRAEIDAAGARMGAMKDASDPNGRADHHGKHKN